MWRIALVILTIFLTSCKSPKPKALDKVKDENINISFIVDYTPNADPKLTSLSIFLDMRDDKEAHIKIDVGDEIHAYFNSIEYQLEEVECSDFYGPLYFCGYRIPFLSSNQIADLAQPLNIKLELRRKKGQLITAAANLPYFLTLISSVPPVQKYNPLVDVLQITWAPSMPVSQIQYSVGQYEHSICYGTKISSPQQFDTYIQYNANEFGLDEMVCDPMSYASIYASAESLITMQTNVALASANIKLSQKAFLSLLQEPFDN